MDAAQPATERPWDVVIQPRTRWFDVRLPELWRHRELTALFVWRDLAAQYKQTVLGPAWHLVQPLLTTALFAIVFGRVAKLPTDGIPPLLFYMIGVTCWTYFSDCLTRTAGTFIQNAGLFGKVYFPRLSVPISVVISALVKFAIQFGLLLVMMVFYGARGTPWNANAAVLLIPILVLMMAAFGLGAGIIIAATTVKYRDLQVLVTFGVQLAMYVTPVIFPVSAFQGAARWVLLLNPMAPIIEAFRYALFGRGVLRAEYLATSGVTIGLLLVAGVVLFSRVERTFIDSV